MAKHDELEASIRIVLHHVATGKTTEQAAFERLQGIVRLIVDDAVENVRLEALDE